MIFRPLTETATSEWKAWRKLSDLHVQMLLAFARRQQWGRVEIKRPLYVAQRKFILAHFRNKCAYCETPLFVAHNGDVEHFRPKKGVSDEHRRPVIVGGVPHPGYFWRAYDPFNLLIACATCNYTVFSDEEDRKVGKGTCFPVEGRWALGPGEERLEVPLLINPLKTDPADHLEYDIPTGCLKATTKYGAKTIQVLDLNRSGLLDQRRAAYRLALDDFKQYLDWRSERNATLREARLKSLIKLLREYRAGDKPYGIATRAAIEVCEDFRKDLRTTKKGASPERATG